MDPEWIEDVMGEEEDARYRRRALSQRVIDCWNADVVKDTVIASFRSVGFKFKLPTQCVIPTYSVKEQEERSPDSRDTQPPRVYRWREELVVKPPPRKAVKASRMKTPDSSTDDDEYSEEAYLRTFNEFVEVNSASHNHSDDDSMSYDAWKNAMYHADDKVTRIKREKKKSRKELQATQQKQQAADAKANFGKRVSRNETDVHHEVSPADAKQCKAPVKKAAKTKPAKPKDDDILCSIEQVCYQPDQPFIRLSVTRQDAKCLAPKTWLNDVLVSYYIHRYCKPPASYVNFDCQLYPYISVQHIYHGFSRETYDKYSGITATLKWDGVRFALVPICEDNHWSLLLIENPLEVDGGTCFHHVDSMRNAHDSHKIGQHFVHFLACEKEKKLGARHSKRYTVNSVTPSPAQGNSFDCGIYVVHYAHEIVHAIATTDFIPRRHLQRLVNGFSSTKCKQFRESFKSLLEVDAKYA